MARILFVWELGQRLHHVANVEVLLRAIEADGHELGVALRQLQHAPSLLSDLKLQYYQAPFHQGPPPRPVLRYGSYAHVLYDSGFAEAGSLQVLVSAWLGILASFRPDLVVFDHSPAALLASRALEMRRVIVGSGFCVPPLGEPFGVLPDLSPTPEEREHLRRDEAAVLAVANRAAEGFGIAPLSTLSELHAQADRRFVLGLPELDPFAGTESRDYLGVWSGPGRRPAVWPERSGARVLVYVSAFPGLARLLEALRDAGANALVYAGSLPPELPARLAGDGVRFSGDLLDLSSLGAGCDLFVSHGSHTSVCLTLLQGVPQLVIPYFREQEYTADRVVELGAGRAAAWSDPSYAEPLRALLAESAHRAAAERFAERQRGFDPSKSAERFRDCARELLGG